MPKQFTIYIDHAYTEQEKDGLFARKIAERLKGTKLDFEVLTYSQIGAGEYNWEEKTLEVIKRSNIIIPIISPEYFSFVSPAIEDSFNRIFEEKTKYLFPILYRPAEWSSFKWLVRNKIIPEDNVSITEHSDNDSDKIINDLISTISEIFVKAQNNKFEKSSEVLIGEDQAENMVFISHDHDDADFAELLKLQLEKNGIIGWLDSERLKIGQDWREEIDENISNSLAIIVIMTPEARKSEYVTYEWSYAWGKGKKIFPLMLKQTQLHPRLESLQYLDFTKRNSRPYVQLVNSIKELIR